MSEKSVTMLVESTVELNSLKDYWYVRTDGGKYYNTFRENNFIALGWNEITVEDIKNSLSNPLSIKQKIANISEKDEFERAQTYGDKFSRENIIDLNTRGGKQQSSLILNKLQNFYKLSKNDIVIIPSQGSETFSFGIIDDDGIYIDNKLSHECDFRKRRKVKWVTHKDFEQLDKSFYTLKRSMHAICSVKSELEGHIDRVMNNIYFKNGYGHFVIRVGKKTDIKAEDLFDLGKDLVDLLKIINIQYGFNEPIDETYVKINVQSEGIFSLKGRVGKSIVALGLIVSSQACSPENESTSSGLNTEGQRVLNNIHGKIDSLQIEIEQRNN